MNIINPHRYGGAALPSNTFIGGVGATSVTSAADYAALTTDLVVGNITNFQIDSDNNVSFFVDATYNLGNDAFDSDSAITYFQDTGAFCIDMDNDCFRNCDNLLLIELDGLAECSTNNFINSSTNDNIQSIYIPLLTPIGGDGTTDQGNFANTVFQFVYSNSANETINGGSPDPDLADATGIVTLAYITDTTEPSSIGDLAVDTTYGEGFLIDWTAPSSTNAIGQYQIFVNGIYNGFTTALSYAITGLSLNTSYSITVKTVDIYYNRSISNTVNATTSATYVIPTSNILRYYPLNSNSDDSEGNGDGVDTSMSYVSGGVVLNRADFTAGNTSKITIADSSDLSFGNGTTDSPFSLSCWVDFTSTAGVINLIRKGGASSCCCKKCDISFAVKFTLL